MDYDIIIYAVVAVVLLSRLWAAFGRRNDDDRQRPNPFITPLVRPEQRQPDAQAASAGQAVQPPPILLQPFKSAPASLAGGLEQIKEQDASFDEKQFLQGAKAAFTMIVEDFAKGDMGRITRLLSPPVLAHFQAALESRRAAGQVMESSIKSITDAETAAARMEGDNAIITVRFVSVQENVLRDAEGRVIGGEMGKLEEITDLWTFTRNMKSNDPNWLLAETGT